ncbi:MAG: hypothetical protein EOM55_00205 [Clostridia bacterium]|nr:hypothetical protein [Clostridia bacterium]
MNIKLKVLLDLKLSKEKSETLAEKNFSDAMKNLEFKKLYLQMRSLNFDISKLSFEKKNCDEKTKELSKITIEARKILAKMGLNFCDFEPKYSCKKCNDTGYVGGKLCGCYYKKLNKELVNNVGMNVDNSHSFEKADFEIFDDKEKIKKIYEKIENWCDKIEESEYKNLLFSGKTGVGKTFLVECICNKLLKKDIPVCFFSAFALNNLFLKFHTTFDDSKSSLLDGVLNADVLIIDDLGTEPKLKNVTEEYFYLIINERLTKNKSTIITTNLSLEGILEKYGERVFSRLCNKRNSILLKMDNKDLRLKRK